MMPPDIQTLLVATDFSGASEAATTYAFHLARTLRARLYLMHVVPEEDIRCSKRGPRQPMRWKRRTLWHCTRVPTSSLPFLPGMCGPRRVPILPPGR